MRVLYLSHTSTISGAERSLLELVGGLPPYVTPVVACPAGDLASEAARRGAEVTTIGGTELSFRLHAWHTAVESAHAAQAARAVRRLARDRDIDLIHANTVRAGLIATLLPRNGRPPSIVHVRDCLPSTRAARLTRKVLLARADMIFTNSRYTAVSFTLGMPAASVRTIPNAVDLERFDPERVPRDAARARFGLDDGTEALGVVGQITPWKAQDDAIQMTQLLRTRFPRVRLLVVGGAKFTSGSTRHDNEAFESTLHALVRRLGLGHNVEFLGERHDVVEILRALDLALVPSWEEPFGRTVIEAMAMETPVLATTIGGPAEIVTHGEDGLLLPPRDPSRWAEAAADLLADPELRRDMGRRGRLKASERFSRRAHVEPVVAAYRKILSSNRP